MPNTRSRPKMCHHFYMKTHSSTTQTMSSLGCWGDVSLSMYMKMVHRCINIDHLYKCLRSILLGPSKGVDGLAPNQNANQTSTAKVIGVVKVTVPLIVYMALLVSTIIHSLHSICNIATGVIYDNYPEPLDWQRWLIRLSRLCWAVVRAFRAGPRLDRWDAEVVDQVSIQTPSDPANIIWQRSIRQRRW